MMSQREQAMTVSSRSNARGVVRTAVRASPPQGGSSSLVGVADAFSADLGWVQLLDASRDALAGLRLDQLEILAARAQEALLNCEPLGDKDLQTVATGQRMLGELLESTAGNLSLLRRLRGEEISPRWGR
jgi:hypothetical protein